MCRIEERIEYGPDGRPMTSQRPRLCENARANKPCRDAVVIPYRYNSKRGSTSREDTPSPMNPSTPTSSGTYLVQTRRPSNSDSRPSTRDGQRPISTEIIIGFGSGSKKDKTKKYPSISVSAKPYDRSSLGSRGSNEAAVESLGSDASYILRTGFPEAPLPSPSAFDNPNSYLATPTTSYGYRTLPAPSASSSQTPSLHAEDEPPIRQRSTRRSAPVIHNPSPAALSSPSQRPAGTSSGPYRTSRLAPRDPYASVYPNPLDNDVFADHSSYTNSGGPEVDRRAKSGEERQKHSKSSRRQEEAEQQEAEDRAKAERENERHVRFELGRADSRAKERGERLFADKEKDRAAAREESRRLKHEERLREEQKDLEEKAARDRRKEKERSKPSTTRPSTSRRMSSSSMTPAQLADQQRLIEAEKAQMRSERQVAEAREREEQLAATLKGQQEKPSYWDPRGGDRSLSTRRESMTRHDSVTSTPRPSGLIRTTSKRRTSISQPNPPAFDTQAPTETYRPSSSRKRAPPPLSFPANFNQEYATRPSSSRRPSFGGQDNPFAASSSVVSPSATPQDPWDLRNVESALPSTRLQNDGRYGTTQPHGYVDAFSTDSDSPAGDYIQPTYASRTGLGRKGSKRKH
ncbi:hypothetical protein G6011_11292 [Alternaria panax]|uniref:Trichoplein multi-domain protein n=1 Tax=Alternaria panax TaxID=48097 RepID=A0AAD4ID81_9PLEO|nr:hypothetical protein G6011_11292 [Alternaria panax]